MRFGRSKATKFVIRTARLVVFAYLVVCLVFSLLQESIIFPGAATQGKKDAIVHPLPNDELLHLKTADGTPIVALFGRAQEPDNRICDDTAHRPTLLFFYGNGMCLADTEGEYRKFRKLGMNVLIPEYVGYGMSGGKPSEHALYATAEAAYGYLLSRNDIDKSKIIPAGWSLGSAAAIEIASRHPGPGLITMSAFTSMHDMARKVLPFFPSSLMLKHHFENERKILAIKCPILILHGKRDSIIPFSMSKRLEHAAGGPVTRICIDDADHNDLFEIGGEEMFKAVGEFVFALSRSPSGG
jgi:pimeloyl-ACP methyl ester carboxylesterase